MSNTIIDLDNDEHVTYLFEEAVQKARDALSPKTAEKYMAIASSCISILADRKINNEIAGRRIEFV